MSDKFEYYEPYPGAKPELRERAKGWDSVTISPNQAMKNPNTVKEDENIGEVRQLLSELTKQLVTARLNYMSLQERLHPVIHEWPEAADEADKGRYAETEIGRIIVDHIDQVETLNDNLGRLTRHIGI